MNIINKLRTLALTSGLAVATVLVMPGCSADKDVFDKTPAERFDDRQAELKARLLDAPNGWIMELIPHKKALYGGYIVGLKFNDKGDVLMTSEALENTDAASAEVMKPAVKSSYNIGRDLGVTLNFQDYNEALHYYSTPDRRYAAGLAKGYEADYEFRYMKSDNPNELNLVGKKTGNKIRMYKAPEDAMAYVEKVVKMKRKMFNSKQMLADHQDALVSTKPILGRDKLKLYYPMIEGYNCYEGKETEDSEEMVRMTYFCTPTGVSFFDHATGEREDFTWVESKQVLERGDNVVEPRDDPYYEDYASYLGSYDLEVGSADNRVKYSVKLEEAGHNLYVLTGLPYKLNVEYDYKNKRFEIKTQRVDDQGTMLCVVDLDEGSLVWTRGYGMYSRLVEGSVPERYEMVDNGRWGRAQGLILWSSIGKGEGKHLQPSRLFLPVFIRK